MSRLLSVLFWSVLAAAFIGPGTVTTAALAGHGFGFGLLWALAFSTCACVVLQEAVARLAIATGDDVGQALRRRFSGAAGVVVSAVVVGAVVVGCAAYEAGNVLGAIAGARLAVDVHEGALAVVCTAIAAVLLWPGRPGLVATAMSVLVAGMGVAFVVAAALTLDDPLSLLRGLVVPTLPEGSVLVVLGLVGTTVVPYNLFLGSGLARDRRGDDALTRARFGIVVAVILGGGISMAIVVVGTALRGAPFSLQALQEVVVTRLGPGARWLLPLGLFCAGLSSAVTAPLAAALTARSLFVTDDDDERWRPDGSFFRATWLMVLGCGLGFGLAGVKPVPVIVMAQALNGLVLPLVAAFLLVVMNDRRLGAAQNGRAANLLQGIVVLVSVLLGVLQLGKAGAAAVGLTLDGPLVFGVGMGVGLAVTAGAARLAWHARHARG